MRAIVSRLWADESGAVAVEYGLIVGLVGVAAISVLSLMGDSVVILYEDLTARLEAVIADI